MHTVHAPVLGDLSEREAHRWAADHARENAHRTAVRVRLLTIYGEDHRR